MKNIAIAVVLGVGLSALAAWGQPGPQNGETQAFQGRSRAQDLRGPPPGPDQPEWRKNWQGRGQWGPPGRQFGPGQSGFGRRGNGNFVPNGRMGRRFGEPPMFRHRGRMGPGEFAPRYRGWRGLGMGKRGRGYGIPPMMNRPGPWRGGQGRGEFVPPMWRGRGGPGMGPMRRGFGGGPGMGMPGRGWGRQFAPQTGRGPFQQGIGPGYGQMPRGFGRGPGMNQQQERAPRKDLAPSERRVRRADREAPDGIQGSKANKDKVRPGKQPRKEKANRVEKEGKEEGR